MTNAIICAAKVLSEFRGGSDQIFIGEYGVIKT